MCVSASPARKDSGCTPVSGGSTSHISNHNLSFKQCMWNATAVYTTLPQDSCLTPATKNYFHSMKCGTSQCTMNMTEAQTTSCSLLCTFAEGCQECLWKSLTWVCQASLLQTFIGGVQSLIYLFTEECQGISLMTFMEGCQDILWIQRLLFFFDCLTLKMEALQSFQTVGTTHPMTQYLNPQPRNRFA